MPKLSFSVLFNCILVLSPFKLAAIVDRLSFLPKAVPFEECLVSAGRKNRWCSQISLLIHIQSDSSAIFLLKAYDIGIVTIIPLSNQGARILVLVRKCIFVTKRILCFEDTVMKLKRNVICSCYNMKKRTYSFVLPVSADP